MKKWFETHAGSVGCSGCCLFMLLNLCLAFLPPLLAIINSDASYLWWWMGFVVELVLSWVIVIVGVYISETEENNKEGEKKDV